MSVANRARAEQHATRAAFFIPGFATALWATLVPFAKARTGINDATLGLVLLCLGAGSLLAMPLSGVLAARLGCRRVMVASSLLICLTVPGLALAGSAWTLGLVLFVFGAAVGAMDCTMNVQAVIVERDARRVMMSGFHAFFSIGGFLGAATMTVLLSAYLPPLASVLIGVGAMLLVMLLSASYWHSERMPHDTPMLALPHGIVLFIGVLAFVAFLGEGAMLDWSAVFLSDVRRVDASLAGVGYVAFTLTMTIARLFGDALVARVGRQRAIVLGALLAAAGVLVLTLVTPWQASLAGYVLVGLGCANIAPALFSLAGHQTRMPGALAITAVSTLGFAGILAGPALIGFAANHFGLIAAFIGALFVFAGIILMLVQIYVSVRDRKRNLDLTGDPWNARTLEWATPSPPPFYNFAVVPKADELDAFHEAKKRGLPPPPKKYAPIHMPKNTGVPLILNIWILVLCFALVWHIWWMAAASFIAMIVTLIVRSYDEDVDYYVSSEEVARTEAANLAKLKEVRA